MQHAHCEASLHELLYLIHQLTTLSSGSCRCHNNVKGQSKGFVPIALGTEFPRKFDAGKNLPGEFAPGNQISQEILIPETTCFLIPFWTFVPQFQFDLPSGDLFHTFFFQQL